MRGSKNDRAGKTTNRKPISLLFCFSPDAHPRMSVYVQFRATIRSGQPAKEAVRRGSGGPRKRRQTSWTATGSGAFDFSNSLTAKYIEAKAERTHM